MIYGEDGFVVEPFCKADVLIVTALEILLPHSMILNADGCELSSLHVARVKLALDFNRANKGLQLRALVEEWDLPRIVRELY